MLYLRCTGRFDRREKGFIRMQRFPAVTPQTGSKAPLILLFERNDAIAVPLIPQLRIAGYDVRAARIPVEVFDLLQREPIMLVLVDLNNAAANRREFWVGLDSQRRTRQVHVLTFRYLTVDETSEFEAGLRVARADVELHSPAGFEPLIEAIRARVPATPVASFGGPPAAWPPPALPPAFGGMPAPATPTGAAGAAASPPPPAVATPNNPLAARPTPAGVIPAGEDVSPFAQPLSGNPFRKSAPPPEPARRAGTDPAPRMPQRNPTPVPPVETFANGFGAPSPARSPATPAPPAIEDTWNPPETPAPPAQSRRGLAYRGYEEQPLAPDDPRIEGATSVVPAIVMDEAARHSGNGANGDRALSTILMDSATLAPQRIEALRSVQQTLAAVGMDFSVSELALLFRFLTPDQLLAALLVSRGLVSAEEIAHLGRVKQELQASGREYDLETLLIMFDILPAEEIRALRAELG